MKANTHCHVAHILYRFAVGGLENGMVNLINRLDPAYYRHSIVCLESCDHEFAARLQTDNVEIFELNKREGHDPGLYRRCYTLLRRLRPTHLHTRNIAALEMQASGILARVPYRIHGEHGWDVHDFNGSNPRYRWLRRVLGTGVHRFVALSRDLQNYLVQRVSIPPRKVVRICNGVDHEKFRPRAGEHAAATVTFGTAGRMKTVKNQKALCEAFTALLARRPDLAARVRLVLVGDGPLRADCEAHVAAAGARGRVIFAGETDDVASAMRDMDVFVLPSLTEGISNTILEAMASGLAVVATDVGGNAELVDDGVTGVLVPAADVAALSAALERYADDGNLRAAHGSGGRCRIEQHFTLERMVAAYDSLYRELTA